MNGLGLDKVLKRMKSARVPTLKDALDLPSVKDEGTWDRWARENKQMGPDYDYSKIGELDARGHGTDKGKLPNHPTFSTESDYSSTGNPGKWSKKKDGTLYFEPSKKQVEKFGRDYYKNYAKDTGDDIFIPRKY